MLLLQSWLHEVAQTQLGELEEQARLPVEARFSSRSISSWMPDRWAARRWRRCSAIPFSLAWPPLGRLGGLPVWKLRPLLFTGKSGRHPFMRSASYGYVLGAQASSPWAASEIKANRSDEKTHVAGTSTQKGTTSARLGQASAPLRQADDVLGAARLRVKSSSLGLLAGNGRHVGSSDWNRLKPPSLPLNRPAHGSST
jgi:hypothetical protein